MNRGQSLLVIVAALVMLVALACASSAPSQPTQVPVAVEPVVVEWSIGPKGGLGEGSAFITQHSWEPKKLEVPLDQPFIIRFTPREGQTSDTIVFGTSLKQEVGMELEDLLVDGQPVDTPAMTIKSEGKAFDVFSREHRGVGGFGSIVTPSS